MNISHAIKLCRTARGMSQMDLAEKANISTSYVSLIEGGKRDISISMVENIATALDTTAEIILFMAADKEKLVNIDAKFADDLSMSILELLSAKKSGVEEARL
ncbi:helix-turn-helix transcriptional regulator (plasmid) [Thiothrix lacustris]|uniref:Helix-turn-helix transcriptional regulator n=1 Tax=Thiothrix lacustris TaxID=525917 RepID=A0ABY9MWT4_9GAMM|nr:helix-turn-helix transcriptional regulator [Thiothrix lacustris]WML92521.1 helix-turn-helix transcriptional regulator [Thiothrix lacustris]